MRGTPLSPNALLVVFLVGLLGAASCTPGPSAAPPSAPPSPAAKGICSSVEQALDAAPNESVAQNLQTLANGEQSGNAGLNAASRALMKAVSQPGNNNAAAITVAEQQVRRACIRLGIWPASSK